MSVKITPEIQDVEINPVNAWSLSLLSLGLNLALFPVIALIMMLVS